MKKLLMITLLLAGAGLTTPTPVQAQRPAEPDVIVWWPWTPLPQQPPCCMVQHCWCT